VEVLDGFGVVDDRLGESSQTLQEQNRLIMEELTAYHTANPEKRVRGTIKACGYTT